jgi:hypothetical protein
MNMGALPKLRQQPSFITIKLPSGKSLGVRGWRVGDEKELLFALDLEDDLETTKIKHIIKFLKNCVDNKTVFDTLSETDLKKVALEVRKISKGMKIEYQYTCPHKINVGKEDEAPCGTRLTEEVNLLESEQIRAFDGSPFPVNENLIISFRDVSYVKMVELFNRFKESMNKYTFYYLLWSIEAITLDGVVYTDFSEEELVEFVDQFEPLEMEKIYDEFYKRGSQLTIKQEITCIKCRNKIDVNFGELLSFFLF